MQQDKHPPADKPKKPQADDVSPAGPHDKPELTDNRKTPGAGALTDDDADSVQSGTG